MKNISFDNPYLLLLIIPLLLIVFLSYFIAIRKDNKSRGAFASLILHVTMSVLIVLAIAGTSYTGVVTETEVIVVADVSYSANGSLEKIDDRISEIEDSLFTNSRFAVITFGKDYQLLRSFDSDKTVSVSESSVDNSGTDIASALDFAGSLFSENSIKRLVLITDARQQSSLDESRLLQSVDNLFALDVQVDAIFLDSNLKEGEKEIAVSSVDFTKSVYKNHPSSADVMLTSSYNGRAIVTLYLGDSVHSVQTMNVTRGFNIINFELPTADMGAFDYRVCVSVEEDVTEENNSYSFTQHVAGELSVLLVTSKAEDLERLSLLYGENAGIDVYNTKRKNNKIELPYTVEELVKYDDIVISEVDLTSLPNYTSFISSVDTVVSLFGKSLLTFGDNNLRQNDAKGIYEFENMLPVRFGNGDRDAKLMTLVLDCSKSMNTAGRMLLEKEIAKNIVGILNDNDKVLIIAFWGDNVTALNLTSAAEKDKINKVIDELNPYQGTMIGPALDLAYSRIIDLDYDDKQVVLISDGLSYTKDSESDLAIASAKNMYASGILLSTVNVWSSDPEAIETMTNIASEGGGKYYYVENEKSFEDQFRTEIADDLTESVIEKESAVKVLRPSDSVLDSVSSVPNVFGYAYAKRKPNATTVLAVDYVKASGGAVEVPLYAYWGYGNGRVSTFTSSLSGAWTEGWGVSDGNSLLTNILETATPAEKIDYPFNLNISKDGSLTYIELIPLSAKPDALASLKVKYPSGTESSYVMTYDSSKYYYYVDTDEVGRYDISVEFSYSGKAYGAFTTVNVSYSDEYNSFAVYSTTPLYKALRNRGEVTDENSIPSYNFDSEELTLYVISFTAPFLIAVLCLFVLDVIVRKLKLSDIKGLFSKISKEGGSKK